MSPTENTWSDTRYPFHLFPPCPHHSGTCPLPLEHSQSSRGCQLGTVKEGPSPDLQGPHQARTLLRYLHMVSECIGHSHFIPPDHTKFGPPDSHWFPPDGIDSPPAPGSRSSQSWPLTSPSFAHNSCIGHSSLNTPPTL